MDNGYDRNISGSFGNVKLNDCHTSLVRLVINIIVLQRLLLVSHNM